MKLAERIEINHFDVVVHPYFMSSDGRDSKLSCTNSYRELTDAWDKRFAEVKATPDHLLIYFSTFDDELGIECFDSNWKQQEEMKREDLKKSLGRRFISFTDGLSLPEKKPLIRKLKRNNIVWNHHRATMWVYGEYMSSCVLEWGELVKNYLKIRGKNYENTLPELSNSSERLWERIYKEAGMY